MITEKVQKALNEQVNAEFYSSFFYLSMAAYFDETNMRGFANWFRVQAQEEYEHAMKIFNFILQKGGKVKLTTIDGPKTTWDSILEVFNETLEHEQKVTAMINNLVEVAMKDKDYATNNFLQWFVTEQVEEEASVEELIFQIEMVGDNKSGLFLLDRELGSRTAPSPAQA